MKPLKRKRDCNHEGWAVRYAVYSWKAKLFGYGRILHCLCCLRDVRLPQGEHQFTTDGIRLGMKIRQESTP